MVMLRIPRSSLPCILPLLLSILVVLGAGPLAAQESPETIGPTTADQGPTREAKASTARTTIETEQATPRLMPGYLLFQENFVRDFGGGPSISDRLDGALGLKTRLEQRWGDTSVYQWIERGVAAYAWFRASTRTEQSGFDIEVDTATMARGKLGVQMSRPLGTAESE